MRKRERVADLLHSVDLAPHVGFAYTDLPYLTRVWLTEARDLSDDDWSGLADVAVDSGRSAELVRSLDRWREELAPRVRHGAAKQVAPHVTDASTVDDRLDDDEAHVLCLTSSMESELQGLATYYLNTSALYDSCASNGGDQGGLPSIEEANDWRHLTDELYREKVDRLKP